ncbi:MAG: hypothetical protein WBF93_22120 [Pirellulales bacterium]
MTEGEQQIVPGISISASGQATVDPSLAEVLFDLAIKLEEPTNLPVDVQHVLAAIVLAARKGGLAPDTQLSSDDQQLVAVLTPHVKTVFADFGCTLGTED